MPRKNELRAEIARLSKLIDELICDPKKCLIEKLVIENGTLDATIKSPLVEVIGKWAHEMMRTAPNFATATMTVNDPEKDFTIYEITIKKHGAEKTPSMHIAELEAQIAQLKSNLDWKLCSEIPVIGRWVLIRSEASPGSSTDIDFSTEIWKEDSSFFITDTGWHYIDTKTNGEEVSMIIDPWKALQEACERVVKGHELKETHENNACCDLWSLGVIEEEIAIHDIRTILYRLPPREKEVTISDKVKITNNSTMAETEEWDINDELDSYD